MDEKSLNKNNLQNKESRIVYLSDSHGNYNNFRKIVLLHKDRADLFLFMGDGHEEFEEIKLEFPDVKIVAVRGNNDFYSKQPLSRLFVYNNITMFMCHGHEYGYSDISESVRMVSEKNGVQVAFYGHTHIPQILFEDDLYVLNPGSISLPRGDSRASYGILDITPDGIFPFIIEL